MVRYMAAAVNVTSPVLLTLYPALLPTFTKWQGDSIVCQLLAQRYLELFFIVGALNIGAGIYTIRGWGNGRRKLRRIIMEYIHRRSFVTLTGHKDPDYRVSVFLPRRNWLRPWRRHWLRCEYRTDGSDPNIRWWEPKGKIGLVAHVFRLNTLQKCAALPEDARDALLRGTSRTPQVATDIEKYLEDACSSEAIEKCRRWPGSAMLGVPVPTDTAGTCGAVLLIECRKPASQIAYTQELNADAQLFANALEEGA